MNSVYSILMVLVSFFGVLLALRLFGKEGMFVWVAFAVIVANIQVTKNVNILGWVVTLGNVVYGSVFLATDILSEVYGKEAAKRAVNIGFFTTVCATVLMQVSLLFVPDASDLVQDSLKTVFGIMPRITLASLASYYISQSFDVWAFQKIRGKFPGDNMLWLRNNGSTMISQLIDSTIFTVFAFYGVYEGAVLFDIVVTTYVVKWLVAVADTPFVYWARRIARNRE